MLTKYIIARRYICDQICQFEMIDAEFMVWCDFVTIKRRVDHQLISAQGIFVDPLSRRTWDPREFSCEPD